MIAVVVGWVERSEPHHFLEKVLLVGLAALDPPYTLSSLKTMTTSTRLSTGVEGLDGLMGGGLLPGTLTVVVGSSGIGKTQLGLQFARAGLRQEDHSGIVFDMTARGDSQSHAEYARRMFAWELRGEDPERRVEGRRVKSDSTGPPT